jgi:uncharacterized protein
MTSDLRTLTKTRSPLLIFAAFFLVLLLALVAAAVLSPAVQSLLASIRHFPLHRIYNRLTMVFLLLVTSWALHRNGLSNRYTLGFGSRWPVFLTRMALGLLAGLIVMAVVAIPLFALHVRNLTPGAPDTAHEWVLLLLKSLLTGCSVALVEESFFRGAMQGTMTQQGSHRAALFVVPLLYASIHFFGEATRVPYDQVVAGSGFVILFGFFDKFREPLQILDAFVALYLVGVLLALVRKRWGDIAGCIGLHAGFVAVIAAIRASSTPDLTLRESFLVGTFDGLLGIWVAIITACACLIVWKAPAKTD